jgi:LmbE family N-acetylglucosaminyl deacetylase
MSERQAVDPSVRSAQLGPATADVPCSALAGAQSRWVPRLSCVMAIVVALHAHPDDEVVLTGGTLARSAAEGHRVVVVAATDGVVGDPPDFAATVDRIAELRASAEVLGVHRVVWLGYADSGYGPAFFADPPGRTRFARADTEEAAQRLATVLREERADLLISYEANGGYGHRDHVKVYEVGKRAAELAKTPRVLYATMPRELLMRPLAKRLYLPHPYAAAAVLTAYSPHASITHRIDVRAFANEKKWALVKHRSQLPRLARLLLALLPAPVYGLFAGREWFVDPAAEATTGSRKDIFER